MTLQFEEDLHKLVNKSKELVDRLMAVTVSAQRFIENLNAYAKGKAWYEEQNAKLEIEERKQRIAQRAAEHTKNMARR